MYTEQAENTKSSERQKNQASKKSVEIPNFYKTALNKIVTKHK